MNPISIASLITALLLMCANTIAAPVLLNRADFNNQISGLNSQIEDFENYPVATTFSTAFALPNATFSATGPRVDRAASRCGANNNCLSNTDISSSRTFSLFPANTTHAGVDVYRLNFSPAAQDIIRIVAVGNSGTRVHTWFGSLFDFFGFYDAQGLISIEFTNFGHFDGGVTSTSAYHFDNLTTASPVPLPATFSLFAASLMGLAALRRTAAS